MTLRRRPCIFALGVSALLLATACGNASGTPDFPKVVSLGSGEIFPSIVNSTLAVGPNRVSMKLMDRDDNAVLDASVHLRYYNLNHDKTVFASEADARFVGVELSYVDEQSGGETSVTGNDGVYISNAGFNEPGDWGVEITITRENRKLKPIPYRFDVVPHGSEPEIGDAAPPSRQESIANVTDISEIDSSSPPRPQMHDTTIAAALTTGKPLVIAFATPAFCRSRTCAPVMDTVMDPLYGRHSSDAVFIHVEPYVLRDLRQANVQNAVPATREWGLQSEPWVFVVDKTGRIAGKFEGIVGADEVESVLSLVLNEGATSVTPAPSP